MLVVMLVPAMAFTSAMVPNNRRLTPSIAGLAISRTGDLLLHTGASIAVPATHMPHETGDDETAGYAIGVLLSVLLRSVGWLGCASIAVLLLPSVRRTACASSLIVRLGGSLLVTEGVFFLWCVVVARYMSACVVQFSGRNKLSSERRQLIWSRILDDPTQSVRTFVASW
mgnify:CR=1 FL=1